MPDNQKQSSLGDVLDKARTPQKTGGKYNEADLGTAVPSADALKNLDRIANDPQYKASAPPDSVNEFKQAIADAKAARDAKVSANEWGEVAQNLADSIVKFGAYQKTMGDQGSTGRSGAIDTGRGIDFQARSSLAHKNYEQDVHNALTGANMEREAYQDTEKAKKQNLEAALTPAQELLKASKAEEDDRRRHNDEMDRLAAQERMAALREGRSTREADKKQSDWEKKQQLALDEKEAASLSKQIEAGKALISTILNEGELPSKMDDKRKSMYEQQAAKAGMTLFELDEAVKKEQENKDNLKEGSGYFGSNVGRDLDKSKAQKNLESNLFADKQQRLQELKSSIDRLSGRPSAPAAAPKKAPVEPSEDQISKYVKLNPSVSKEQAAGILRKRLNGQ